MFKYLFLRLLARYSLYLLLLSLLASCSNVRFSTNEGKPGTGITTGGDGNNTAGNGDNNNGGNNNGNDGNNPGGNPPGGGTPGGPTPTVPLPPSGPRDVNYSLTVPAAKNQVDFLLVIDNSASMIAIQEKLASSMTALTSRMNSLNIDWQMCLTTTTNMNVGGTLSGGSHTCLGPYCTGNYTGGTWHWGVSLPWANGSYILNKATLAASQNIFTDTIPRIGAGDPGTGDERGVKAAFHHFENWKASQSAGGNIHNTKNCYRSGAAVAVILLSDEDERSVAGDCSRVNTSLGDKEIPACRHYGDGSLRVLEFQDQPANLVSQAQAVFGNTTRFTFNSIIADTDACQNELNQKVSFVKDGVSYYSPHYTGTIYKKASELTQGGITSLCSSDLKLNLLSEIVVNKLEKLSLQCAPVAGSLQITVNGAANTSHTVNGAVVTFNPALVENQTVQVTYRCP